MKSMPDCIQSKSVKGEMVMKIIARKFETIFAAVAFAEGGEFEMAKHIVNEFHSYRGRRSNSNTNRVERFEPLKANK